MNQTNQNHNNPPTTPQPNQPSNDQANNTTPDEKTQPHPHTKPLLPLLLALLAITSLTLTYQNINLRSQLVQLEESVIPTPTSSQESVNEASNDTSLWNTCENSVLSISLKHPDTYQCNSETLGDNDGSITLASNTFRIFLSTLGRGGPCGDGPQSSACNPTPFFSNELIETKLYTVETEKGEIFGDLQNGWLSITLSDNDPRTLANITLKEKKELQQILSTLTLTPSTTPTPTPQPITPTHTPTSIPEPNDDISVNGHFFGISQGQLPYDMKLLSQDKDSYTFSYSDKVNANNTFNFSVRVDNLKSDSISQITLTYYINDIVHYSAKISSPNYHYPASVPIPSKPGTYALRVVANEDHTLPESTYDNNVVNVTYTIK